MDGILTSPLKTPNPFNHQLHGRKPFDTHLNDARTGTEFFQKFGDSAVYALSFDPRIKSNRGWVEKSLYASDFSSDEDGWTATRGTLAGNIDSIGGQDDNLRLTAAGFNALFNLPIALDAGVDYEISFDYYWPASNFAATGSIGVSADDGAYSQIEATVDDTWTSASFNLKKGSGSAAQIVTVSYATDLVYLRNVTIKQVIKDPVVHLLRDSDSSYRSFTAPEIASGVMLNWVTEGAPTSNGLIHTAYDPSGNGNDATQTTVANMPKLVDAGTLVTDALGNVGSDLDGSDDSIALNSTISLSGDFLVCAVASFDTVAGQLRIFGDATGNADGIGIGSSLQNFVRGSGGTPEQSFYSSVTLTINTPYLISYQRTGTTLKVFINGSEQISATFTSTINVDAIGGASAPLNGKLANGAIFNADMSAQRPAIEAALAQTYGITLA